MEQCARVAASARAQSAAHNFRRAGRMWMWMCLHACVYSYSSTTTLEKHIVHRHVVNVRYAECAYTQRISSGPLWHRRLRANARARGDVAGQMEGLCVCVRSKIHPHARANCTRAVRALLACMSNTVSSQGIHVLHTHTYIHNRADTRLHYKLFTRARAFAYKYTACMHITCV